MKDKCNQQQLSSLVKEVKQLMIKEEENEPLLIEEAQPSFSGRFESKSRNVVLQHNSLDACVRLVDCVNSGLTKTTSKCDDSTTDMTFHYTNDMNPSVVVVEPSDQTCNVCNTEFNEKADAFTVEIESRIRII